MTLALDVYMEQFAGPVGHLSELDGSPSALIFTYSPDYLASDDALPLSLQLPLRTAPYEQDEARAFFENLLPEGRFRDEAAVAADTAAYDVLGILARFGRDCAGSVSVVPAGAPPAKRPGLLPDHYSVLGNEELVGLLKNLEEGRPAGPGTEASVAGVQAKIAVARDAAGRFYRMKEGAPSNCLIKVADRNFPGGVINEFFCNRLAQRLGLPAMETEFQTFTHGNIAVDALVTRRYDRLTEFTSPAGDMATIRRLHQEDLAQACGVISYQKYEHKGGPGISNFRNALLKTRYPAKSVDTLMQLTLFNLLIGNSDAHAKNLSLLWTGGAKPELAPLYDLLCIRLYPRYRQHMAICIGGTDDPDAFDAKNLVAFAAELGLNEKFLLKQFQTMLRQIIPIADDLASKDGLARSGYVRKIVSAIAQRAGLYAERFDAKIEIPDHIDAFVAEPTGWGALS